MLHETHSSAATEDNTRGCSERAPDPFQGKLRNRIQNPYCRKGRVEATACSFWAISCITYVALFGLSFSCLFSDSLRCKRTTLRATAVGADAGDAILFSHPYPATYVLRFTFLCCCAPAPLRIAKTKPGQSC